MFDDLIRSPRIEVRQATLRDASFVMANLRPDDDREVMCQLPLGLKNYEIAKMLQYSALESWVACYDDAPAGFFGVTHMTVACASIWALGTKRFARVAPTVTRVVREDIAPRMVKAGYRTLEARSHIEHLSAHRWMHLTGAQQVDNPYVYGRNGEQFITFRWTSDLLRSTSANKETTS